MSKRGKLDYFDDLGVRVDQESIGSQRVVCRRESSEVVELGSSGLLRKNYPIFGSLTIRSRRRLHTEEVAQLGAGVPLGEALEAAVRPVGVHHSHL